MTVQLSQPPILPEEAVKFAWALTIGQSGAKDADLLKESQKDIDDYISNIKKKIEEKKKVNQLDISYIDAIYASIHSCVRTLHIIIRGRDTNFAEVDNLKDVYIKKAEDIVTFSATLQSSFGRITTMTVGSTSATAIVAYFFPTLPEWVFPLVLLWFGGVSFVFHELVIKPWQQRQNVKASIRNDFQRNQYYLQYVKRCQAALTELFKETFDLNKKFYKGSYNAIYDNPEEIKKFINDLLKPLLLEGHTCPMIYKCFTKDKEIPLKDENLDKNRWATCESGQGYQYCPDFIKAQQAGEVPPSTTEP